MSMKSTLREYPLGLVAFVVIGSGLSAKLIAADAPGIVNRDYFPIPDVAMVRTLGEIPPGPCDPAGSQFCNGAPRNPFDAIRGGYLAAATWYHAGERFADPHFKTEGIAMGVSVADQIWKYDENGFAFDTPLGWKSFNPALYTYPGYSSPLGVWDVMDAIKPFGHLLAEPSKTR